ncbi:MAG: hypothetical protein K8R46_10870, partial [Pirellulales bacterium]|nr:hypothetical protein [Pirellulales bacterium]
MTVIHVERRRRTAIWWCASLLAVALTAQFASGEPVLRVKTDPQSPAITFLSWDTEGGERTRMNLLRSGSMIRVRVAGAWSRAEKLPAAAESEDGPRRYRFSPTADAV